MCFQRHLRRSTAVLGILALFLYGMTGITYAETDLQESAVWAEAEQIPTSADASSENEINTSATGKGLSGPLRFAPLPAVPEAEEHFLRVPEQLTGRLFSSGYRSFRTEESVCTKNLAGRFGCLFERLFSLRE